TDEERAAVDGLLGAPKSAWDGGERGDLRDAHTAFGGREAREQRHLLLPALRALQSRVGWISETGLEYVCLRLNVPPADAWGVATFYALLSTTPRPSRVLHVCDDVACRAQGAAGLCERLEQDVGPAHSHGPSGDHVEIDANGAVWMRSPCLGFCDHAPAAFLQQAGPAPHEELIGGVTPQSAIDVLRNRRPSKGVMPLRNGTSDGPVLLKRIGVVDPTSIAEYQASGGFDALRKAFDIGADAVIREVIESKLMGRGGAAFPTGRKWDAGAAQAARPHPLTCTAVERGPGPFP